jgi:hypothetical protein
VFFPREYFYSGDYHIPFLSAKAVARGRKLQDDDRASKFDKNSNYIADW